MLDAALDLARQGWAVHPCREAGQRAKAPYLPHGHLEASTDPDTVRTWWSRWPNAMIGARVPDTLLVLDIDPRNGGSMDELQQRLGTLPSTLVVTSGRGDGGRHLYYLRPAGPLSASRLPKGVDLKVNGYCIMPPSLHPATGRPYVWGERQPARLPSAAVAALYPPARRPAPPTTSGRNFAGLVRTVAGAEPHSRNNTLFWAACRAVDEDAPADVLDDLAAAAVAAGLTEREATATINSARRRKELVR